MGAFATQIFIGDAGSAYMSQRQAAEAVGLVHFKNITLQHGVVRITMHFNAHIGKHMTVIFNVLTHLEFEWVFEPSFEFGKHLIHGQLHRRIGAIMAQRQVGRFARLHAPADAHQIGAHGV